MCFHLPRNETELGHINGVGERKLEKYGAQFLQVINEHAALP